MITKPIYILTKLVFLQLYPAYMCYKAIKVQQQQQFSPLIIYWSVTSLYLVFEYITDIFFFWFPFYYELKLVLVLWLILPQTNGTELFYTQYINPFLSSHEAIIDQTVVDIQTHVKSRIVLYGQKIVQFLRTFVSDSVFKSFASSPEPPAPVPAPLTQRDWSPYGIFAALLTTTQHQLTTSNSSPSQESTAIDTTSSTSSDTSMERVDSFDSLGSIVSSSNNNNGRKSSTGNAAVAPPSPPPSSTTSWSGYVSSWVWKPQSGQTKNTKQD